MRSSSFSRNHPYAKTRGWVSPKRAASSLPTITDGVNEVDDASEIWVLGGTVSEPEEGVAQISFGGQAIGSNSAGGTGGGANAAALPVRMFNSSGVTLIPGDVVVTDPNVDSGVTTTATASNTRIAGIVQAPIDVAQWGPVLFNGFAPLVNTTGTIARGNYALTSATATLAGATAARVAGSFAVYLTGTDLPDFVTDSRTTEVGAPVTSVTITMPPDIPVPRVLFLALWFGSGVTSVAVDGWTRIGSESGFYYFYKVSEGDDIAEATWTTEAVVVATVLVLHPTVALSVPVEDHDYDTSTSAAAVAGLNTGIAHYALAGVDKAVTPGSGYVRLGGGTAGSGGAIALVETTTANVTAGTSVSTVFSGEVPAGQLLLVYAWRRDNNTGPDPTPPAGWTTCITHHPYENDKSPGLLFSKISDGSAADGGSDGTIGPFTECHKAIASRWSGAGSATPSDDDIGTPASFPGNHTVTKTVTPAAGGLAVMVSHDRNFGPNTMAAGGSSTLLIEAGETDWPVTMVYRLGGGSLTNTVDITTSIAHWDQSSAVAFDPGTGSAAGTLAGKYIAHVATATSPFTGAGAQNDAVFAVSLSQDAKASALLYGPDLGSGSGEPTADAHIADSSDAHDASAVSLLDSAALFTATDVEAAIAELAAKDIGYTAHGNMGASETFNALTGWHSGTFDASSTFTFSGATSGIVASMVLELTENGTGGYSPTWPGSVVWPGGVAPTHVTTAGTTTLYLFQSRDGGTTWYGFAAGGSAVGDLDDLSDVTITAPAEDEQLQYVGGQWVNSSRRWEPVTHNFGSGPELVWSGDDLVMEWKEY